MTAMKKYVCKVCGYVYDPAANKGIPFESLPAGLGVPDLWCRQGRI